LRTRSDVPIVNIVPVETGVTKVNVEDKLQTIVIPAMPMFMHLNHNISARVYGGDGPGVGASRRGGKGAEPGMLLARKSARGTSGREAAQGRHREKSPVRAGGSVP